MSFPPSTSNQILVKMADALCGLGNLTGSFLNSDESVMGFVPFSQFKYLLILIAKIGLLWVLIQCEEQEGF